MNRRVRRGIELAVVLLLPMSVAIAAEIDQKVAQFQRQNGEELKHYTWKLRTEVQMEGKTRNVQLTLMRYDMYGTLQKTPLSSSPQQQGPSRGLRGRIAQKKRDDVVSTVESLDRRAKAYGEIPSDRMQRFLATATVAPETRLQQRLVRATGTDVLQPDDSMTIWLDAETRKPRRVEVQTTVEGHPMRLVSDFQDLPNGPTYAARSVIDYPKERLTVIAENFDYERVAK